MAVEREVGTQVAPVATERAAVDEALERETAALAAEAEAQVDTTAASGIEELPCPACGKAQPAVRSAYGGLTPQVHEECFSVASAGDDD